MDSTLVSTEQKLNVKIEKEGEYDFEEVQNLWHKIWLSTYPNKEIGITTEDIDKYFANEFPPEKISN